MPVTFDISDNYEGGHVVCFPAISQKDITDDDPQFLRDAYGCLPGADYYKQHAASATARGKPGTYTVHSKGDDGGLINMFIRVYPGTKVLANDNNVLRVKYFRQCLDQLVGCKTITRMHMKFPAKPEDVKDFIPIVEDFCSTYKLNNGVEIDIIIHHPAPTGKTPIVKKAATTIATETFQLVCEPSQILEQSLFEVDFIRYRLKDSASTAAPSSEGIMKYFPTVAQWNFIRNDPRLNQLATEIPRDIVINEGVYPPPEDIFNAFTYMKGEPKVILLGQDPYHRKGQAHGLSFSVMKGVAIPPSLRNVYKALTNDVPGFTAPKHGHLRGWAEQGVLMLNSALTVEEGKPASHMEIWEPFTDHLVSLLSQKCKNLVFMLWGTKSKSKKRLITGAGEQHLVLECQHPSPQIANNTFEKDCTHFSQANAWLKRHGKQEINWELSP
jgi:uracil-DNA glycosylase